MLFKFSLQTRMKKLQKQFFFFSLHSPSVTFFFKILLHFIYSTNPLNLSQKIRVVWYNLKKVILFSKVYEYLCSVTYVVITYTFLLEQFVSYDSSTCHELNDSSH